MKDFFIYNMQWYTQSQYKHKGLLRFFGQEVCQAGVDWLAAINNKENRL